jgi:hypothetical protein
MINDANAGRFVAHVAEIHRSHWLKTTSLPGWYAVKLLKACHSSWSMIWP